MSAPTASKKASNFQGRAKLSSGHQVAASQTVSVPKDLEHHLTQIPALSQPAFGGMFLVDLKNKGVQIENLSLQFLATGLYNNPGLTYVGTLVNGACSPSEVPYFSPVWQWVDRIECVINGQIIDTLYGQDLFIKNQLFYEDAERIMINSAGGSYQSVAQRQYKSKQSQGEYILNMHSWVNEHPFSVLTPAQEIQLRVFMNPLSQVYTIPGLVDGSGDPAWTGTPTVALTCNAIIEETNLAKSGLAVARQNELIKSPMTNIFHDTRLYLTTVQPCASTRIILTSIVGQVSMLYFVVNTGGVQGDSAFKFTPITSFALYNSSNTNIVGGQTISDALSRKLLTHWCKSSYPSEWAGGHDLVGDVRDNGASVYAWSFSADTVAAHQHGQALGSHHFQGNEVLEINFPSSFSSGSTPATIHVFASTEQFLHISAQNISKVALQ